MGQLTHSGARFRSTHDGGVTDEHPLRAGRTALREGRWDDARAAFMSALADRESAEALAGVGEALWWQCQARDSVGYRERAYLRFREQGDPVGACRTAVDLSISYLVNLGNEAAARGWLARAERVVAGLEPNPMRGWLWLQRAFLASDPDRARESLEAALRHARDTGDVDLELVALADLGLALVQAGEVEEGMALLDEAMAATLAGEYRRLDTVVFASCDMLAACNLAGDLERATQWCRVADAFTNQFRSPFLYARCRVHYGSVLLEKGQWAQAEGELRAAIDLAEDAGPGPRGAAVAGLAVLRCRQGRPEEAEALLAHLELTALPALPAAAVRLACGEPGVAAVLLGRHIRQLGERHIEAPAALALLVEACLASGEVDLAAAAADRLAAAAQAQPRLHPAALATLAAARVAAARGQPEPAAERLERALHTFSRLGLPLETARVRLELATLHAQRRPELAVVEARAALAGFEALGAMADADAAAALLRSLGAAGRTGPKRVGLLTKREQEVLRLVGLGLSNPEIAQRLFISRKTAARHVSNLLAKLGLRNRAEAVAYAVRELGEPAGKEPGPATDSIYGVARSIRGV